MCHPCDATGDAIMWCEGVNEFMITCNCNNMFVSSLGGCLVTISSRQYRYAMSNVLALDLFGATCVHNFEVAHIVSC